MEKLCEVVNSFFVDGTIQKQKYGQAPVLKFGKFKENINVSLDLKYDIDLISSKTEYWPFYYGPALWMIGENVYLDELQTKRTRNKIIHQIFDKYPTRTLRNNEIFYKIRINPINPGNLNEYDASPKSGKSRFSSKSFPILYVSKDLETCIHECRCAIEDEIYFATLSPLDSLSFLDLSALIEEKCTSFESLDLAVSMLFSAGEHSYPICRKIALHAFKYGYNGIIYPSYYSSLRMGTSALPTYRGIPIRCFFGMKEYFDNTIIKNIAIFGNPIKEKRIVVRGINRLQLQQASYKYILGPVISDNSYVS
jgi:hypothetical protein